MVYYHDLYTAHAGGILNYTKALIKHSPPGNRFIYWGKKGVENTKNDYNNLEMHYLFSRYKVKFLPNILQFNFIVSKHRMQIDNSGDILFLQLPELTFPWMFKNKGIPIVLRIPGCRKNDHMILSKTQVTFNKFADRTAIKCSDKVIVVSREGYEYYTQKFPKHRNKIIHIPTFADDDMIPAVTKKEAARLLGLGSDKIICYIGRLDKPKKLDLLIEVFYFLQKSFPSLILCMAGKGPMKKKIEDLATERGIIEKIKFLGVLDRKNVGLLFRASDLNFLLTSFEGNSLSLMESLACGTPSVVSDVADHKYIIQNGQNGYVVQNDSPEEIALISEDLLNNYPRLHQSTLRCGKKHLATNVVPKLIEVFHNTLREPQKGSS